MKDKILDIIVIISICVFCLGLLYFIVYCYNIPPSQENSLNKPLRPHSYTYIEGLAVLDNNSLLPMSYLPRKVEVLGSLITVEEQPYWLEPLIWCESRGDPKAWNKDDPNGGSYGLLQFQSSTFYNFAKIYNLEAPDIWNPEQQIWLAKKMIDDGLGFHWSCWYHMGLDK